MTPRISRILRLATAGVLATTGMLATDLATEPVAEAATASIGVVHAGNYGGHIGIDMANAGPRYENENNLTFWSPGQPVGAFSLPPGDSSVVRFELYPNSHDYDPWEMPIGSVHVERTAAQGFNLGDLHLPTLGESFGGHIAFEMDGQILSSDPLPNGRVEIDIFQVDYEYLEPRRPLPTNAQGVTMGGFATSKNRGDQWTGGVMWPGYYVIFVRDMATGNSILTRTTIDPNTIPTIDLDAVCFGFDICEYTGGGPTTTAGEFHPTPPTRVLDTRNAVGIFGPVQTGWGANSDPNPVHRRQSLENHELKVTGLAGVPEDGVSAVLLNVTAVGAPGPGFISAVPRPPHCCVPNAIWNDQASIPTTPPPTSNLNINGPSAVPNLVLARVGAGGTIRIYNSWGPTHVIADLAGWIGTGGAHTDGVGFTGTTPARVFDSRVGIGTDAQPFAPNETRSVQIAGVAGVPSDAESVVVNLTAANTTGYGYTTAFPTGTDRPNASNINYEAGQVRSNLSVVQLGDDGRISLFAAESRTDLIVDVMGSFGPSGGSITAITPERIADSRGGVGLPRGPLAAGSTNVVRVAGVGSVPANATAVIVNVTAANAGGPFGYLTVYPTGVDEPDSSNVNYGGGRDVPNLVMVKLGDGGSISVLNEVTTTDVLVDVFGYVT